jgi:polyhydroxybutyrate depolymerase
MAGGASGAAGSGGGSSGAGGSGGAGGGGGSAGAAPITCPASVLPPGDTNKTVEVNGTSRSYVLHVPAAYDGTKAVPLIIDFHGLTGNGPGQRSGSPYPAQTDAEGVIMAFPSGLAGPSGAAWNVGPCCVANVDDVAFAKTLVAEVSKSACIDPKRVYATGFSMGGGMSHYLACHAADVFAAVAPAAFDLLEENVDDCEPARPISIVSFRSTGDGVVDYDGGYSAVVPGMPITFLGAEATFEKWADINECPSPASAANGQGCSTYSGCQGGVEVTLCTKQGGGHDQGTASVGWPLLKKYTLP